MTMAQLGIQLSTSGVSGVQSDLGRVSGSLNTVGSAATSIKGALVGLTAGLTVGAFAGWIKSAIDAGDATKAFSQKTGVAAKDVAGLQLAFKQGGVDSDLLGTSIGRLSKNMVEGNAAFGKLGVATRNADGSMRSIKAVLYDTADAFAGINDGAGKSALATELFSKAGAALIPTLNEGSSGLRDMADMAERLGLVMDEDVADAADRFNDTTELLGMGLQGIGRQIAAQMLPALNSLAGGFLTAMTDGQRLKNIAEVIGVGLKGLYSIIAGGIQIVATLGDAFGALGAAMAAVFSGEFKRADAIMKDFTDRAAKDWKATIANIGAVWDGTAAKSVEAGTKIVKAQKDITLSSKDTENAAKAAAAAEEKRAGAVAKLIESLTEKNALGEVELATGRKLTEGEKQAYAALVQLRDGTIQLTVEEKIRLGQAVNQRLATEALVIADQARLKTMEDVSKLSTKLAADEQKSTENLRASVDQLNEQNEKLRIGEAAWRERMISLNEVMAQDAEFNAQMDEGNKGVYLERARLLREQAAAWREGDGLKVAKETEAAWQKVTDSIGEGLTDSLFRAFESGKDFFATLWGGIKNVFKTTVLRLVIEPFMKPISQMIGAALGSFGGVANAAGGVSSGSGILGSLGSIASAAGSLGTIFGTGAGLTLGGNFLGAMSSAGAMMSAGATGSGLAMGAGALGPYVAAAVAIYQIAKSLDKSGTPHMGGYFALDYAGNVNTAYGAGEPNRRPEFDKMVEGLVRPTIGALNSVLTTFGLGGGTFAGGGTFKAEDAARDGAWGVFQLDRVGGWTNRVRSDGTLAASAEEGFKQFTALAATSVRAALDSLDLPAWAADMLSSIADDASMEEVLAGIDAINTTKLALVSLGEALEPMGGIFGRIGGLSEEARLKLAGMVGGIEALIAKSQTFVQAYYSEGEQAAIGARSILEQVQRAGVDSATYAKIAGLTDKAGLRALLESVDVRGAGGLELAALGLNIAGPFAQIAEFLSKSGQTLGGLASGAITPAVIDVLTSAQDAAAAAAEANTVAVADVAVTSSATAEATKATAESMAAAAAVLQEIAASAAAQVVALSDGLGAVIAKLTTIDGRVAAIEAEAALASAAPAES